MYDCNHDYQIITLTLEIVFFIMYIHPKHARKRPIAIVLHLQILE